MRGAAKRGAVLGRPSQPRRHPEDDLQKATADFVRRFVHPSVIAHHSANERPRKGEAAKAKGMGQLTGFPDWFLSWGRDERSPFTGFIELKSEEGTLSDPQKDFRALAASVHARWALCRTLEEFAYTLKAWNVPMRCEVTILPRSQAIRYGGDAA